LSPYVSVEIDLNGNTRLCGCASWMPAQVGNIFENTIESILSNSLSRDIRKSISSGTYEYCNEKNCGIIIQNQLQTIDNVPAEIKPLIEDSSKYIIPHEIVIAGDIVCNLSCPSCRTHVIKPDKDKKLKYIELGKRLKQNLFSIPTDKKIRLLVSTSGEVFSSPMLLSFLSSISVNDFPNLELLLQTNGLLAEKNWHRLGDMQKNVAAVTVTVDAARKDTYEKLRRGGQWTDIQRSLQWLSYKKQQSDMKLNLRMVAQLDNYHEIVEFYSMAKKFNADRIEYVRISNWSTFAPDEFAKIDVFNNQHAQYKQAQHLIDSIKDDPAVWLAGGIS
jgi:wyosine [tRNA(Phe)-imidazoG37] synthetase (radical SAM superfamily)